MTEDHGETVLIEYEGGALFQRVCKNCGRFVKADDTILVSTDGNVDEQSDNATCSKCGRVSMPFMGFY